MRIELINNSGKTLTIEYSEPNVHIYNSYAISKADIADWIEQIKSAGEENGYTYLRSNKSWEREWHAHNLLFKWGIKANRAKDVDLNEDESLLRRLLYWLLSLLYNTK